MRCARPLALAALAALAACKKESPPAAAGGPPITGATTDALWAYAPADLEGALVVADGVLASLLAGGRRALADLEHAPGGAPIAARARQALSSIPVDVLDPAAMAAAGIDLARGAAVFVSGAAKVAVLPVSDAKKLMARVGGTSENGVDRIGKLSCRQVGGHYLCADTLANLEIAAKAGGAAAVAGWKKETRGHVELFVSPKEMGPELPLEAAQGLRMAATFERGAVTVRAHLIGTPTGPLAGVRGARSPLLDGLADQSPIGLLVVGAARVWDKHRAAAVADAPTEPLPGGASAADLARSIRGDLVGHAPPGAPPRGQIRIGLSDDGPMKKLIAACGVLAAGAPAGITVTAKGERCSATVDPAAVDPSMAAVPRQSLEVWVEPGALVLQLGAQAAPSTARAGLDPFAAEILTGEWLVAGWSRGALAPGPIVTAMSAQDPTGGLVAWAVTHLSELGVAVNVADDGIHAALRVRTLWANPDEVVAAVQAAGTAKAADPTALDKIAAAHPSSPFARDLAAGQAGLIVHAGAIGVLAAVAVPAFTRYQQRARSTEARLFLQRMATGARQHALEHAGDAPFPKPGAGPTPPLGECCRQGGTCAPDPSQWEGEPWRSLRFSVDEPHLYSYEYKVDGTTFTAVARGDLDCDGVYSTFTLRGSADGAADGPIEGVDETE